MELICEICGRRKATKKVFIEGSWLFVCPVCGKGKKGYPIESEELIQASEKREEEVEEVLIEDYGKKIKEAREKLGLTREEMAKKLGIKESYLAHIETEKIHPDWKTLRKIEKFLKLTLTEKVARGAVGNTKKEELSLAEILSEEERRKLGV